MPEIDPNQDMPIQRSAGRARKCSRVSNDADCDAGAAVDIPDALTATEPAIEAQVEPLADRSALQEELARQQNGYLRLLADFENYKKRTAKERRETEANARAELILKLLPVLDNLERALCAAGEDDTIAAGVRMVYDQMQAVLTDEGLAPIQTRGCPFDPSRHEAIAVLPFAEVAEGLVAQETERGYLLGDRVLRLAKVVVSAASP